MEMPSTIVIFDQKFFKYSLNDFLKADKQKQRVKIQKPTSNEEKQG